MQSRRAVAATTRHSDQHVIPCPGTRRKQPTKLVVANFELVRPHTQRDIVFDRGAVESAAKAD